MKPDIHPTYHTNVTVTCACGTTFVTGSTTDAIQVEICSTCHPFFTGKSKLIDTAGRVDKFKARLERAQELKATRKPKGKLVEQPAAAEVKAAEKSEKRENTTTASAEQSEQPAEETTHEE